MTLIITEISEYGIAMVADSAETRMHRLPSGSTIERVLTGVRKLQTIDYLRAGISMWGLGSINIANTEIPTDVWIEDFIARHDDITSVEGFANELAHELQQSVGGVQRPMGLHLAGYVDHNGQNLPAMYHIRNCDGKYNNYEVHDFVPGLQIPP
jgi:hypothetical protein